MALTFTQLVDAVAKYAGKSDAHSKTAYQRNLTLLRGRAAIADHLAELADDDESPDPVVIVPPTGRVPTADEIWAKFLDAEDAALEALGRPHGREGGERGGMSRAAHIALVEGLGIPNALAILAASGYSFGELDPSISQ